MKTMPLLFAAAVAALTATACDKKEKAAAPPATPPPVADTAAAAPAPTPPSEPAAPAYSPEAAAKLLTALESCEYDFNCDAYEPLVSFGTKVSADLAKLAADASKPAKARGVAAKALGSIKDPATGEALLAAARAEKEFMLRADLFAAAGASGNEAVLTAAGEYIQTEEGYEQRLEVQKAIVPFGKKAFDWAVGVVPKPKKYQEVGIVDLIAETATAAELPTLQELTGKVKDEMSKNRLASRRIQLGDLAAFDILWKNLASKDEYVRADTGNMLARVADKISSEDKQKAIDLVTAAKAKDQGGLTSQGYETILKALNGGA
jgi:hypothetical protein